MARRTSRQAPAERPASPPHVEWPREFRRPDPSLRFAHVRLELDVLHEGYRAEPISLLAPLTVLLHEREVESTEDLLQMSAQVIRVLSAAGFRQVDHWEARPGGWLPLPEPTHARLEEPVAHLLRALHAPAWAAIGSARSFAVRLSGRRALRVDLVVRRVHRERTHAVSLDLWGPVRRTTVKHLVERLHRDLPLDRAEVVAAEPTAASTSRPK